MAIVPISTVQYLALMACILCLHTYGASANESSNKPKYTTHPLLYYTPDEVQGLQLKALTTHAKIANILKDTTKSWLEKPDTILPPKDYKTFGSKWNEIYGNNLAAVAFYCVLFPEDREALSFTLKYMDIMVNLPKWQVIAIPDDEVPVAHSLTGFTTAYDMLYSVLDSSRRKLYLQRIVNVTKEFYDFAKYRSWGKFYLQNHVATNYLALIHGALVASAHYPPAIEWLEYGKVNFEKSMKLLNHIVDGSLDEGVAYGSYTSRSVTQYIFLALRHFDIDHTQEWWIKQHYWFFYNTILPRFQRTVGIADSNNNWFYGPESQLVFLDTYVLKNGYGNWLANEIRQHRETNFRTKLVPAPSQIMCTIHTEFIWYDARLGKTAPPQSGRPNLHTFSDWGVVTFSHVHPKMDTDTFLAFKSGKLHGRGIFDVVQRDMYSSWVKGWRSFNPGHEHPDQNTFVFAPGGQLFITDRLYSTKYTYLNNVWSFAPSPTSQCLEPWEGQLGECTKWLNWRKPEASKYGGDVIMASLDSSLVFTSGEAVGAYNEAMKLKSVYRSLMLVNHQVLVVLDHIETKSVSPIFQASTFFHNLVASFEHDQFNGKYSGVKINTEKGPLRMYWIMDSGSSPKAKLDTLPQEHTSQFQPGPTNFVNITMELSQRSTRVAYVLLGHRAQLTEFDFIESTNSGVKLSVKIPRQNFEISIATDHSNPISRHQLLGFPGFASLKIQNSKLIKFGFNDTATTAYKESDESIKWFNTVNLSLGFTMSACVVLYLLKGRLRLKLHRRSKVVLTCFMLVWLLVIGQLAVQCSRSSCFLINTSPKRSIVGLGGSADILPSVVITALPGSGAELIGWLFYNNPDVAYVQAPSDIVTLPKMNKFKMNPFADACMWSYDDLAAHPETRTWIQLLRQNLPTFVSDVVLDDKPNQWRKRKLLEDAKGRNKDKKAGGKRKKREEPKPEVIYKEYTNRDLYDHIVKYPNAQTVLHFTSGSWGLKLPWLHGILGHNLCAIHVVRDPRSWVGTFLRNNMALYKELNVQQEINQIFEQADEYCIPRGRYAEEYDKLKERLIHLKDSAPHLLLAWLWSANTQAVLRTVTSLPERNSRLVRFEDLVNNGENTANLIYKFIGKTIVALMKSRVMYKPNLHFSKGKINETEICASNLLHRG